MKYKIDNVITKKDNVFLPILAEFQNGSISPEEAEQMECYTVDTTNKRKAAVAFRDKNVYHGVINDKSQTDLVNTYIAITNKRTKTVKIIQVDQCSMINDIYEVQEPVKSTVPKQLDEGDATKILLTEFSGKKAKRYYDKNIRIKTNIDVLENQLESSLVDSCNRVEESEDSFTKAQIAQELQSESVFPPVNLNATTLKEVYDISNIIPQNILDNLTVEAINFLKDEASFTLNTPYLYDIIGKIQNEKDPDSPENLHKVIICFYIDALIQLLNIPNYKMIQRISGNSLIFKDIQERFSQDMKGRKIAYTHRKAICYFLVFSLMLSEKFEINVDHILGLFKTSQLEIRKFASAIGGVYIAATNTITLKLPKGKGFRILKTPRTKR